MITGHQRVGKTTILLKIADRLKYRMSVGGVISKEIRKDSSRIGFEFIDLASNAKALLASIDIQGPKVGKYHVSLEGCKFAANLLYKDYDLTICDELGPMELKSNEFRSAARSLLNSNKHRIVSIHKNIRDPLIDEFKKRADLLITVTLENRDLIADLIIDKLKGEQYG